jgi:serine O-acetyltransferase
MAAELEKPEQCVLADETTLNYRKIPLAVHKLLATCKRDDCFDHVNATPIPSLESVIEIIHQARQILFPGYFSPTRLDSINLEYRLGQETTELFEKLSGQVILSIQHDCIRYNQPCSRCTQLSHETGLRDIFMVLTVSILWISYLKIVLLETDYTLMMSLQKPMFSGQSETKWHARWKIF